MQTAKAPRMSKSKSRGKLVRSRTSEGELTLRTSIDDLRNPDGRQTLRQHFTGAFPETQLRPSLDSVHSFDADSKSASGLSRSTSNLTTSQSSLATSNPSSESLNAAALKRLSTVRESNLPAIDVTQAIKLLEELKKTATAAELVALHKALLPSRDSLLPSPALPPSQHDSSNMPAAGFVRRRSMLPPGLATRNAAGDLWRTPEEAASEKSRPSTQQSKKSNRGACDVPDAQSLPAQLRSITPSDFDDNVHMGAYGPGTLRITNGPASPEPTMMMRKSFDTFSQYHTAPTTPVNAWHPVPARSIRSLYQASQGGISTAPDTSSRQISAQNLAHVSDSELHPDRRASEPAMSGIPVPEDRDDAAPRFYRRNRPEKKSRSQDQSRGNSQTRLARSRASSQSRLPVPVDYNASSQPPVPDVDLSDRDLSSANRPGAVTYEGTVLPANADILRPNKQIEMPRFAQRLSYRISQLSQDATTNTSQQQQQLPLNPEDDGAALDHLSSRLSNVTDVTTKMREKGPPHSAIAEYTPEVALAKPSGVQEHIVHRRSGDDGRSAHMRAIPDSLLESPMQMESQQRFPGKDDSGYTSDVPGSKDVGESDGHLKPANEFTSYLNKAFTELSPSNEEASLYSFRAVLNTPDFFDGPVTPSPAPPNNGRTRKRLSLLGLGRGKRSGSIPAQKGNDLTTLHGPQDSSPADARAPKPFKKLQKAMPAAIKQEIKSQKKKTDAATKTSFQDPGTVPDVPEAMAAAFKRRSHMAPEPVRIEDVPEYQPVLTTEPMELLAPVPAELSDENEICETPLMMTDVGDVGAVGRQRSSSQMAESQFSGSDATIRPRARSTSNSEKQSITVAQDEPVAFAAVQRAATVTENYFDIQAKREEQMARIKPAVFTGMDANAASELARMRSRDAAAQKFEDSLNEKPKTATPRSRRDYSSARSPTDGTMEPYADYRTLSEAGGVSRSASSVAESIPPIPRIPSKLTARISRLDEQAARRMRESLENSAGNDDGSSLSPGFSTESIADAVKRAKQERKASAEDLPISEVIRIYKSKSKSKSGKEAPKGRGREVPESSDDADESQNRKVAPEAPAAEDVVSASASSDDLTGWEDHAKAWRQRRQSVGKSLGKPVVSDAERKENFQPQHHRTRSSTSVYSIARKPVPGSSRGSGLPKSDEASSSSLMDRRSGSAEFYSENYRNLIGDDKKNEREHDTRPAYDGADFAVGDSTTSSPPNEASAENRIDSAYLAAKSYLSAGSGIERARSPGGRVMTANGNYHPYTVPVVPVADEKVDEECEAIKRARALSLAKLTGTNSRPKTPVEAVPTLPASLSAVKLPSSGAITPASRPRTPASRPKTPASRPRTAAEGSSLSSHHKKNLSTSNMIIGRYSGGLEFNYLAGEGFGGSAGTRAAGETSRRNTGAGNDFWGVDLSDVPFLAPEIS